MCRSVESYFDPGIFGKARQEFGAKKSRSREDWKNRGLEKRRKRGLENGAKKNPQIPRSDENPAPGF